MTDALLTDVRRVIAFAIAREEAAARLYARLAALSKHPGLTKLLLDLQDDEKRHKDLLEDLGPDKIRNLDPALVEDLKLSDELAAETPSADMTFQEALVFAAKKEAAAVVLYETLAARTSDPALKQVFEFLRGQEKVHKLKIESEYERLVLTEN
ncbi:MAG: rubrerythrin [Candidatus Aminicenantes bacterium]|nr:rubrerythrin [Candidatus Aminicenantes bacterium]